jgi:arylsulfatase A-like enzyme
VAATGYSPSLANASQPPNVLFVVTDDQRVETLDVMPRTKQLFDDQGTHFQNAYVTTPLCCPSRSSILTGRYAHNHGVKRNNQGPLLDHSTTIERHLQEAGYKTGIFGKFLNNWTITQSPPYFDRWSIFNNAPYTNFRVNEQGEIKMISDYATSYVAQEAVDFVQETEQEDERPWFLYVAPTAPHEPFTPEARYQDASVPDFVSNPAYFEPDRSDKPPYVRGSLIDPAAVQAHRVAQLRMLMSVDDLVSSLFDALGTTGETDNTLAFFVSDNGYMWGEHGLEGKHLPYTHSTKIPMYMRWPDRLPGGVDDPRIVANIDLAPTAMEATNLAPEPTMDGRSLLRPQSRDRILFERLARLWGSAPHWASIRTASLQYTEYYGAGTITYAELSTPPAGPTFGGTVPVSPANDNSPKVKGTAAIGSTVRLYKAPTTSGCTPANLAATGKAADFASPGLTVSVPDNSVTRFRAIATDAAGNTSVFSSCSKL